ncbi:CDP-alcohol phosphatidyltransferase family protein [Marinoscillum sp.]|uniref:CDP-alcohol phosphatidyltransferase family protein n=1 Tax=Marinoscillum sp. TaxID=2024838 RepID=UPI003BAC0B47
MFSFIKRDFRKSSESIKLMAIEETFDIYFSRFSGYYFALLSKWLKLTPNQVSVASLIAGLISGYLFYFQDNLGLMIWACFFITLSGVLDSADGQLARMTGQSSDLGRKIDAIIDTFVFIACYVGGALFFIQTMYSWWILPLAALAGYFHSAKSAAYEYYKTEFIYYIKGVKDHRIPYVEEVEKTPGKSGFWYTILYYLEVDYIRKQALFHGRSRVHREAFERHAFGQNSKDFRNKYTKINEPLMTWWALVCGTNTHRTVLMVTSLFGRMDIYFWFAVVTTVFLWPLVSKQRKLDRQLMDLVNSAH